MSNFRKICAATALLLAFSFAAQASSGWISTGFRPTPTPESASTTTTSDECEAGPEATEEESDVLDLALDVSVTILQSVFTLL